MNCLVGSSRGWIYSFGLRQINVNEKFGVVIIAQSRNMETLFS